MTDSPGPATSLPALSGGPSRARLDVWLWAVRMFKTRSLAAEACRLGRVTRGDGAVVKPSSLVRPGDEWCVHEEFLVRRVRTERLVARRIGAKLVPGHVTELTPLAEVEKARVRRAEQRMGAPVFVPGAGRPTKAQRRALEAWHRSGAGEGEGGSEEEP